MTIDVFSQYFSAEYIFGGVRRRAALVSLTSDSAGGNIRYVQSVTFFPHTDDADFAVSYDAVFSSVLYEGAGRRSKKREAAFIERIQESISELISGTGAAVFWEKPLRPARLG